MNAWGQLLADRRGASIRGASLARAATLLLAVPLLVSCRPSPPVSTVNIPDRDCVVVATPPDLFAPLPEEVAPGVSGSADRLIECVPVAATEREDRVLPFVEDLVIAERADDPQFNFDRAVGLAVDAEGRFYVHDSNRYRIVVYGADGGFERAYGGAGDMAPFRLGWIAVAGGRLAISTGNKITVWSLDGEHLYDRSLLRRAFWRGVQGTESGALVGPFGMLDAQGDSWYSVESVDLDRDTSFTYGAVSPSAADTRPRVRGGFAVTRQGDVYLTRGDTYLVQGFDPDGTSKWALRVRDDGQSTAASSAPALSVPRGGPGLGHPLRVDGHGNLYVFPHVPETAAEELRPVDVYSPDGRRLFAGYAPRVSWLTAKGDYVYGIEGSGDDERIVRYRAPDLASR